MRHTPADRATSLRCDGVGIPVIPPSSVGSVGLAPLTCVSASVSRRPVNQARDMAREFSCLRTQICDILALLASNPIIAHRAVVGFSFYVSPWDFSPPLFTTHALITHVKAPQTDFHIKPDNSSVPTYDSPSERPLRKKATFQHRKAPKKHRGKHGNTKQRDDHPSQARTNYSQCSFRSRDRSPGPKGRIETKTASVSML